MWFGKLINQSWSSVRNVGLNLVEHQRSLILFEMGCGMVLSLSLSKSPRVDWLFFNFCRLFYSHVWDRISSEKLWGERWWLVEKKDLFNCKFIFTFQADGSAEPTCAARCLIPFGLDNIQLMLPFSTETYACGVFICLFIYIFCWCIGLKCISKSEEISVYNKNIQGLTSLVGNIALITMNKTLSNYWLWFACEWN